MALTSCPDINTYLLHLLLPREFLNFGMVDKYARTLILRSPIYAELSRLKFDKHLHRFDSYQIIKHYYKHNMINLITQHKFDHYRAIVIAAKYGHLDLIKLIYHAKPVDFPYACYNFICDDVMNNAIMLASNHSHHHLLKWFAEVGIIDSCLVLKNRFSSLEPHTDIYYILMYAGQHGDLDLLIRLKNNAYNIIPHWHMIVITAFEYCHIAILDWIFALMIAEHYHYQDDNDVMVTLPYDTDPVQTLTKQMLNWHAENLAKFSHKLFLNFNPNSLPYQLDILEQIHAKITVINSHFIIKLLRENLLYGNLDLLQWVYDKDEYRNVFTDNIHDIIVWVISADHLHIMKWLESKGLFLFDPCFLDSPITCGAMSILRWLKQKEINLGKIGSKYVYPLAKAGYLHTLVWLKDHELLHRETYHIILEGAIVGNHLHILEWLGEDLVKELVMNSPTRNSYMELAFISGHMDIWELFCRYGLTDDIARFIAENDSNYAAGTGSYYEPCCDSYIIICWLTKHNIPFDAAIILDHAIHYGEWNVVDWLAQYFPNTNKCQLSNRNREKHAHYLSFRLMPDTYLVKN